MRGAGAPAAHLRRDWQRDRRVQNALTLAGWRLLRVTAEDLELRAEEVAAEVRAALEGAGYGLQV